MDGTFGSDITPFDTAGQPVDSSRKRSRATLPRNPGAAHTHVIRDGHGDDLITDFRQDRDRIIIDMAEIQRFSDIRARLSQQGPHAALTFDNGDILMLHGIVAADLRPTCFTWSAGPSCLLAGTPIRTERGDIPVEELRPDDILWTRDRGWQALRLVVLETMTFTPDDDTDKPVRLPQGSLGQGLPQQDLILSPNHRILRILPTGEDALVPAINLIGRNGIRQMQGKKKAHYLNVVLEDHSIIQAAGCWVESMLVTKRILARQTPAARKLMQSRLGMVPKPRIRTIPRNVRQLRGP